MPRLIDANKLKNHYAWWEGGTGEITYDEAKKLFDTIVDLQPTVEQPQKNATENMVEIVRCKDCRWFENDGFHTNCKIMQFCVEAEDCCSRGERKEDAKTN